MPPARVSHPDLKAITVFLASTATSRRGGLPYLDAVLPAEHRLAAARVLRDLGAVPPDAILYLLAQPLLDLASDHLTRDQDLTARYEERLEVEDSEEWTAVMAGRPTEPRGAPRSARHNRPTHRRRSSSGAAQRTPSLSWMACRARHCSSCCTWSCPSQWCGSRSRNRASRRSTARHNASPPPCSASAACRPSPRPSPRGLHSVRRPRDWSPRSSCNALQRPPRWRR